MELTKMLKLGTKGFKPADIKRIGESGIEVDQIIALSENGYSSADVDELIKLASDSGVLQPGNETDKKEPVPSGDDNDGEEGKVDYKAEYENKLKELEGVKKSLKKLQDDFASKDLSGVVPTQTAREIIQEAFKNLY